MKNVQKPYELIGKHFGQKKYQKIKIEQNRIASDEEKPYATHLKATKFWEALKIYISVGNYSCFLAQISPSENNVIKIL